MAFETYLTYDEYVELGGKVAESTFPQLERKARRKLDYFTFGRIQDLTVIPDEVKETITEYINLLNDRDTGNGIASYSNGNESVTYSTVNDNDFNNSLYQLAVEYLPVSLVSGVI